MVPPSRRLASAIGTLAALAALAALAGTAQAAPPGPACGETITADTTLTADLLGCPGDGLVIGAGGVTLDLAGHRIGGDGVPGLAGPDRGIVAEGRTGISVVRGHVEGFDFGIVLDHTTGAVLRRLDVRGVTGRGLQLQNGSNGNLVEGNASSENGRSGIALLDSSGNLVRRNRVVDNALTGIRGVGATGNMVEANVASGNGNDGIAFADGSDGNRFAGNAISDSQWGVLLLGSSYNLVRGNRVDRVALGVAVEGDGNRILANRLRDATGCVDACEGCGPACATGVTVEGGAGNLVAANVIHGSDGTGIRVNDFGVFGGPHTLDTVLRGNLVLGAATDGIAVGASGDPEFDGGPVENTLVEDNRVMGSGKDGIRIEKAPTTLRANRALHNAGWGIRAVPGVTDGGANHAVGNGLGDCLGVAC